MSDFPYVPPLAISRVLLVYEFEGGDHVALVATGKRDTSEMLDKIEELIAVKRSELLATPPSLTHEGK